MTSNNPEPVVVFYKSSQCRHCHNLSNIWGTVTTILKKIYPKIRFFILTANSTGKFDENVIPKDLIRYGKWFPMVLLVPGKIWDTAMSNLGPNNTVEIKDGVQMINAIWENGEPKYELKYDIRKAEEFGRWLKDALENDDFKRVQWGDNHKSIQPLINGIIRPNQTTSTHSVTSPQVVTSPQSQSSTSFDRKIPIESILHADMGDVCSMRIIPRPT